MPEVTHLGKLDFMVKVVRPSDFYIEKVSLSNEVFKKHSKKCFNGDLMVVDSKKSDDPFYAFEEMCRGCGHKTMCKTDRSLEELDIKYNV